MAAMLWTRGELARRANDDYWPWHILRHKAEAAGVDPPLLWVGVRLTRRLEQREFPLVDTSGQRFGFWLPLGAQDNLHFLDRRLGGLLATERPEVVGAAGEQYLISSLMEEAIASSILEGAATTRAAAKEMLQRGRHPRNRAERMVLNNYRTVARLKDLSGEPLTEELLLEIHASITEGTLESADMCGRFRTASEPVLVSDRLSGETLHTPPPADELPERVQRMCEFANEARKERFIHPIVRATLLHFWLAYDHPFVDGNGRAARALLYWYLLRKGYWLAEFVSISRVIRKAPVQYRRAFLWSELDDADATYFVVFHLKKLREAVAGFEAYLERKTQEARRALDVLKGAEGLNLRQCALVQHALEQPDALYTIKSHRNTHGVAYATARGDLYQLEARGLLERRKVGREFVFMAVADIAAKLSMSGRP
jgi:Fic family protein